MHSSLDQETRAVHRLIDEIDALDRWRDRTGRHLLAAFAAGFLLAAGLLVWTIRHGQRWADPPTQAHTPQRQARP